MLDIFILSLFLLLNTCGCFNLNVCKYINFKKCTHLQAESSSIFIEDDALVTESLGQESFQAPAEEINRRRTFAIISHPDAGKTTLTEKLLLFGGAIQDAGAVKARADQRKATSDWV